MVQFRATICPVGEQFHGRNPHLKIQGYLPCSSRKVKKTGQPVLVTRFGHPVAQITPPAPAKRAPKLGTGIGSITIHGDIVGPISDLSDWEAARESEEEK